MKFHSTRLLSLGRCACRFLPKQPGHTHPCKSWPHSNSSSISSRNGKSAPTSFDHPDIKRIHRVIANFAAALRPGAWIVDRLTFLKYFRPFTRTLDQWHYEELQLFHDQVNRTKEHMVKGDDGPSLVRYLLDNPGTHNLTPDAVAYVAGTLYGAGADTTAIGMTNIFMAAAVHPQAQEMVIEEIDTVLADRLPSFDDIHELPQLEAFIHEALRWRPISPLGFPHMSTNDIIRINMTASSLTILINPNN